MLRLALTCVCAALVLGHGGGDLDAAGDLVVARADLAIAFTSPTACHVRLQVTVEGPLDAPLEQRLMLYEGTGVSAPRLSGATATAPPGRVGRTFALVLARRDPTHTVEYDVVQPREARFRCPVWLPIIPTRTGPGRVRVDVTLPPGATPVGSRFPLLSWTDGHGRTVLGDLPSVVRTTFESPGDELSWRERIDPGRATDLAALGTLVIASIAWGIGRRRSR